MCVVEKAAPGVKLANLEWIVDATSEIEDANLATISQTSGSYKEYTSVEYDCDDPTPTQNYGEDGTTRRRRRITAKTV